MGMVLPSFRIKLFKNKGRVRERAGVNSHSLSTRIYIIYSFFTRLEDYLWGEIEVVFPPSVAPLQPFAPSVA